MITFGHAEEGTRISGTPGVARRYGDAEEIGGDGESRTSTRRRDGADCPHGRDSSPGEEEGEGGEIKPDLMLFEIHRANTTRIINLRIVGNGPEVNRPHMAGFRSLPILIPTNRSLLRWKPG